MASKPTIGGWLAGAVLIGTLYMLVIPDDRSADENVDYSGGVEADTASLRDLLDGRQFDALETELDRLIDAYMQGVDNTEAYGRGFGTFGHVDLRLQAPLDAWVAAHPDRFEPYFARSIYLQSIAWSVSTNSLLCNPGRERQQQADDLVRQARDDAETALRLRDDLGGVYAVLISTVLHFGDKERAEELMRRGLAADPRSYSVRYSYLWALRPYNLRYRLLSEGKLTLDIVGDYAEAFAELSDYLDQVADDAKSYPWLKGMLGTFDAEVALSESFLGLTDKALDKLDDAEAKGGHYEAERGAVLYNAGRFEELVRYEADAASELQPGKKLPIDLSEMAATAYGYIGQQMHAAQLFDRLLQREPDHPMYLYFQAYYLRNNAHMDRAWKSLEKALVLGEAHSEIQFLAGEMHFRSGEAAAAIPYLKRAAELVPSNPKYFYYWAKAQFEPDLCLAREPAGRFLALCTRQGCEQSDIGWARTVMQLSARATACSGTD